MIELLFGKVFFSWMLFYFFHSFLLYPSVRSAIIRRMKWSQQGYRIFFNLFSGLSMLLVLALQFRHQAAQVVAIPMLLKAVALILMLFSVYMLKQSFKNYRLSVFIGIERETQMDFSITGLNAYMRHPLYFFSLMAFLSKEHRPSE